MSTVQEIERAIGKLSPHELDERRRGWRSSIRCRSMRSSGTTSMADAWTPASGKPWPSIVPGIRGRFDG